MAQQRRKKITAADVPVLSNGNGSTARCPSVNAAGVQCRKKIIPLHSDHAVWGRSGTITWTDDNPTPVGQAPKAKPFKVTNNVNTGNTRGGSGIELVEITIPPSKAPQKAENSTEDAKAPSVLVEASRIIKGARRTAYGPVEQSFSRIAARWSLTLGVEVSSVEVALCMNDLKIERFINSGDRDSLVDMAGYTGLLAQLSGF